MASNVTIGLLRHLVLIVCVQGHKWLYITSFILAVGGWKYKEGMNWKHQDIKVCVKVDITFTADYNFTQSVNSSSKCRKTVSQTYHCKNVKNSPRSLVNRL